MDHKHASNTFPIHELLKKRWSPRAFENQFIEPDLVRSLFEAARWSPSASNIQPWHFILGLKGDETYASIASTLVEFNLLWATRAPLLFISVYNEYNAQGIHNPNALYDLGQSVAHLTVQASSHGLYVHQMSGFDLEKAKALFDIPEGYKAATVTAVGYMGDYNDLHPNLIAGETSTRERRMLNDTVFSGKFGQTSKLFEKGSL